MDKLTAYTITDDLVQQLKSEALAVGDSEQYAICLLALDGFRDERAEYDEHVGNIRILADYYDAALPMTVRKRLAARGFSGWTQEVARQHCADAINNARALEE